MTNGLGYAVAMTRTSPLPFFADPARNVHLYCGDALDLLRSVRDGCFDVVFADPLRSLSHDSVTCADGAARSVHSMEANT